MSSTIPTTLAMVPPLAPPPLLPGPPMTYDTLSCSDAPASRRASTASSAPRSLGIESKPAWCTMNAPDARAASSCASIMSRAHSISPVRSQQCTPSAAQRSTSSDPYLAYGPTVVATTRVRRSIASSEPASRLSATSIAAASSAAGDAGGTRAATRSRTARSLDAERPASAHWPKA